MRRHGDRLARLTGLTIEVKAPTGDFRIAPDKEIALFRITQEALSNVVRHARATHVVIMLRRDGADVSLLITDDGIGFDRQSPVWQRDVPGWGLLGMRERAEVIGARLAVDSALGAGTTVRIEVSV